MVQYRHALSETGATVSADEIAGKPVSTAYSCLGCGGTLIAKVNGEIQRPHFAHKVHVECSGETYLHRLGKAVFEETYRECLDQGRPFIIRLSAAKECPKFRPALIEGCSLGFVEKEYDLTQYYSNVVVEKRDGVFVPDLRLHSSVHPDQSIYVEIAVTHFLSEEKALSGNRIIQIPLEVEEDVEKIRSANLTATHAMFIGFSQRTTSISDSECKCARIPYYGFFIFKSGKAFLEHLPLMAIQSNVRTRKDILAYSNVFLPPKEAIDSLTDNGTERGSIFRDQLSLAVSRGIAVKNCYLCRYHGSNWDATNEFPIYCKTYHKACSSNEAASCDRFRSRA